MTHSIAPVPDTIDALRRQNAGYRTLNRALEQEITSHSKKARQYHEAVTSLDSEREANARLTDEIEELRNEARIFDEEHADQNRMVDRIAELIGLPHDQELSATAFELWFSANAARTNPRFASEESIG